MPLISKLVAEFLGTLWLVLGGCGSAVLAAAVTEKLGPKGGEATLLLGIAFVGVSLAFGLTVLTMAYAVGHISGGHFNPAVSFGLWAGKRFPAKDLLPYIGAQVAGAIVGGGIIYLIAIGQKGFPGFSDRNPLATNGFGDYSPNGYSIWAALITEVVMTFFFLIIILGATDSRAPQGFAPVPIGLGLTLIHLISIPVTNTSVNPARSTGVALFAGAGHIAQLWLFWLAPIVGAIIAGYVYNAVFSAPRVESQAEVRAAAYRE
jgi:aquaporin Z